MCICIICICPAEESVKDPGTFPQLLPALRFDSRLPLFAQKRIAELQTLRTELAVTGEQKEYIQAVLLPHIEDISNVREMLKIHLVPENRRSERAVPGGKLQPVSC